MNGPRAGGEDLPPYARALGIVLDRIEHGVPVLACDPSSRIEGRPGFFQGGALAGLLEMAALEAVRADLGRREAALPVIKPINVSIQFMRNGDLVRTFATGRVVRAGRRLANVTAEAWQEDRGRLIASVWMNVKLG
ncbi:MAG: PaaI family thioesterase [Sphingomonadales bacterium]|nr:PaaI family thioesterase [Sphingomonadales bacterium]